jgi:hypothetical protein
MKRTARTVDDYLGELPPEQREMVRALRAAIRAGLPAGYDEAMLYGGIAWTVPLSRYPETYNGQPLAPVTLVAQKAYVALYLSVPYADASERAWLERAWAAAGKRLEMGKSCVRMRRMEDVPLDVVRAFVARTPPERFIALYESSRRGAEKKRARPRTTRAGAAPKTRSRAAGTRRRGAS